VPATLRHRRRQSPLRVRVWNVAGVRLAGLGHVECILGHGCRYALRDALSRAGGDLVRGWSAPTAVRVSACHKTLHLGEEYTPNEATGIRLVDDVRGLTGGLDACGLVAVTPTWHTQKHNTNTNTNAHRVSTPRIGGLFGGRPARPASSPLRPPPGCRKDFLRVVACPYPLRAPAAVSCSPASVLRCSLLPPQRRRPRPRPRCPRR